MCESKKAKTHRNRVEWWLTGDGGWGHWGDVDQSVQTCREKN